MENITIAATERTPDVNFEFENNVFFLGGESYPENVSEFYDELTEKLKTHLAALDGAGITFNFEFVYFNSSTAKVLFDIFDLMDETAESGNTVTVNWIYEEDDDHMEELGEEFGEDLENATFNLQAKQ